MPKIGHLPQVHIIHILNFRVESPTKNIAFVHKNSKLEALHFPHDFPRYHFRLFVITLEESLQYSLKLERGKSRKLNYKVDE